MTKATDSEASTESPQSSEPKDNVIRCRYCNFITGKNNPEVMINHIDACHPEKEVTDNADSQDGSANTSPQRELAPSPTGVDNLDTLVLKFADQITILITKLHHKEIEFDFANSTSNQYQEQFKAELTSLINQTVKDARGCIDCKKLRCENCERLWQT